MLVHILKRNRAKVPFDAQKITHAIFKASLAVGQPDWKKAQDLSREVLKILEKGVKGDTPKVEEVQDAVERVLINNGLAKVAKAYILYRKHRAELRKEKSQVLNKGEIDEVDKKFDVNALRVLAARYLRKDENGKIVESPKSLFERVSVHTVIPSLFYDEKVSSKRSSSKSVATDVQLDLKKYEGKLSIGRFRLNHFHIQALGRLFARFSREGKLKVSFPAFIKLFSGGYFDKYEREVESYCRIMISRRFMPNTPAIANFGNSLGMGSACFVLDVEDDIGGIMDTLKAAAIIFKAGGGVGYNFSKLRPEGSYVKSTGGLASGPISFISMFDNMTDVIKQGGIRRGANMGILNSNHPDIAKFIKSKEGNKALRNFNISILLMPEFWECYEKKEMYPLVDPRSGKVTGHIDARQLFDMIAYQAWESAEPGVIFFDHVNEYNPFYKHLGPIVTTNPCGEVLLYPNESCNLGSINVWAFVQRKNGGKATVDWKGLEEAVRTTSRFLDNVIDINLYPLPQIEEMTLFTRKIGLGIMGIADLLYELEIPYNSRRGLAFMEKIMEFINYHSKVESLNLARERGSMPAFSKSFYQDGKLPFSGFNDRKSWHFDWAKLSRDIKKYGVRNGYTTVIAPTGSISMIAGCSSGIEPVYSLVFEKHVTVGSFYYVNSVFEERMQREGLMGDDLIKDVAAHRGTIGRLSYIPKKLKRVFITAHDITPQDHIKALAAFQRWTDSSISKTNNFPVEATVEDVKEAYELAYKLGCKDVTVFRDGSITNQVLISGNEGKNKEKKAREKKEGDLVSLKDVKAKGFSVYKEASVHEENGSLDLSPTLVSVPSEEEEGSAESDFPGGVKCRLCNL